MCENELYVADGGSQFAGGVVHPHRPQRPEPRGSTETGVSLLVLLSHLRYTVSGFLSGGFHRVKPDHLVRQLEIQKI